MTLFDVNGYHRDENVIEYENMNIECVYEVKLKFWFELDQLRNCKVFRGRKRDSFKNICG